MNLDDRIKEYEAVSSGKLLKRTPVIIRLDGKAFHSFTRGFEKPFDPILNHIMQQSVKELCSEIQNVRLAYSQSDEISLLLIDYSNLDSQQWFDGKINKICSVSASIMTRLFNKNLYEVYKVINHSSDESINIRYGTNYSGEYIDNLCDLLEKRLFTAEFDSRCFNLPKEEVCNYFIWRQQDAVRNSIQGLGQSKFSQKELHGKSCDEIQEMLFQKFSINWNFTPDIQKRGFCFQRIEESEERKVWKVDNNIPIFTQDRDYIEKFI